MKNFIFLIVFMLGFVPFTVYSTAAEETGQILDEYISIYGEKIEEGINKVSYNDEYSGLTSEIDVRTLLKSIAKGEAPLKPGEILSQILLILISEVKRTLKLLLLIPAVAVLNTYVNGINSNFSAKGAADAAFFVCYAIMAGIAATAFLETVKCGRFVIENVSVFMRVLIPVSLASLASSGAVVSATTFEMVLMSVIGISEFAVEKFFFPIVMMSTALNIASNISNVLKADKLVGLLNKTVKWGLGIMLTLFVGITGLQGVAAGTADGLTVKVTKFATANLIPVVGGILAETVETVMNCSVAIKNAVGVVGIISVIAVAVIPILKIAACLILFRLCAAAVQPISDPRYVKCISELGDSVSSVLAMAVSLVVMFVIILTILINIGNTAILLGR